MTRCLREEFRTMYAATGFKKHQLDRTSAGLKERLLQASWSLPLHPFVCPQSVCSVAASLSSISLSIYTNACPTIPPSCYSSSPRCVRALSFKVLKFELLSPLQSVMPGYFLKPVRLVITLPEHELCVRLPALIGVVLVTAVSSRLFVVPERLGCGAAELLERPTCAV